MYYLIKNKIQEIKVVLLCAFFPLLTACFNRELRGYVKPSTDKKTYLVIMEKDNPNCIIYVDGTIWSYQIGEKGIIEPGIHKVQCVSNVEIEIQKGTTFNFNYWGP